MKKCLLSLFFLITITNAFAQIVIDKNIVVDKNTPFNDDSSLYPDKYGVYGESEHEPIFPGGKTAYKQFILKNLKWPDKSGMKDIYGKVVISFVVEKNGKLTNFKVTKKLDPIFDSAAINTLKKSPRWHPGTVNGRVVRVRYSLPFDFSLH